MFQPRVSLEFIPVAEPHIASREKAYVIDALNSGWVSSIGSYVDRFEQKFAAYTGVAHAVAVSNGTVALHLALHALGIGPGDEVIIPALTFVATAHAVLLAGATPVIADVDPLSWCIDPVAVEKAITPRTKAIMPVHLYGHAAEMNTIATIANTHSLYIVEDAAEAHGATYDGRRVGSLGTVGAFSFYGNKIVTTGEGGMVTTNDDRLADRLRFLKDHGMAKERPYYHTELAFNYRLTNIQAALGLAQLEQIDKFIDHRRAVQAWYVDELSGLVSVQLNAELPSVRNVYWMSCLVLDRIPFITRDKLIVELRSRGIDSRPFFIPLHELPHLAQYRAVSSSGDKGCPQAERLGRHGINLPTGTHIDQLAVQRIAGALRDILHVEDSKLNAGTLASSCSAEIAVATE